MTNIELAKMSSDSRVRYERKRISRILRTRVIRYARRNDATVEQIYEWLKNDFAVSVRTLERWLIRAGIYIG